MNIFKYFSSGISDARSFYKIGSLAFKVFKSEADYVALFKDGTKINVSLYGFNESKYRSN